LSEILTYQIIKNPFKPILRGRQGVQSMFKLLNKAASAALMPQYPAIKTDGDVYFFTVTSKPPLLLKNALGLIAVVAVGFFCVLPMIARAILPNKSSC